MNFANNHMLKMHATQLDIWGKLKLSGCEREARRTNMATE